MDKHILIIGATLLDSKGRPSAGLEPGTSNPATIRHTRGGTARNVAENLARLGADALLISAVGDDRTGQHLLDYTADAGVNVDYVQKVDGYNSGSYIALIDDDGFLSVALDDVLVMENITPNYLYRNRKLFRDACMVMIDGSLNPETTATAANLAKKYHVPLCADPSSSRLANRLCPYLDALHLLVPNEIEAAVITGIEFTGYDPDASMETALNLVKSGVGTAVVTLSDFGLAYATSDETGHIPARYSEMADSTGTGDAVSAAIIFGMVNDLPTIEAIRLGAAAASLTLQTNETVVPELSLDLLYNHLTV